MEKTLDIVTLIPLSELFKKSYIHEDILLPMYRILITCVFNS